MMGQFGEIMVWDTKLFSSASFVFRMPWKNSLENHEDFLWPDSAFLLAVTTAPQSAQTLSGFILADSSLLSIGNVLQDTPGFSVL